ncbi:MAG: NAD(P)/FAD-dependent oxidoreductase [Candidatus Gracilibacteria bacterium]|nr:NAD(P)/FAD-dependent oxidoreductase [Candidatus Gracilibacteria bacterium]
MNQLLRLEEIKLSIKEDESNLEGKIIKLLGIKKEDLISLKLVKKSIDSRDKRDILFIYSVDLDLKNQNIDLEKFKKHRARFVEEFSYLIKKTTRKPEKNIVIVGTGPAGLFCGLALAKAGLKPIIIERGKDVDSRIKDVDKFMSTGELDVNSNIQFGEGGAGTFSDGKLYTLINDHRSKYVFEEFIEAGAPAEIAYNAKPHVGTDKLRLMVKKMREKIINLGGEVRFETCMTDLEIENDKIKAIIVNGNEKIEVSDLIIALGHSARDTYEMIYEKGLEMTQKAFAMGVRIEHSADMINRSQFGESCINPKLGTASYKLVNHSTEVRSIYSFCMCPGGHVVAAASENGRLCTNGMSEYKQDSGVSNSALLVSVTPEDFGSTHPLAGINFQRKWEEKAFLLGGSDYKAPAQLVGDFLKNIPSTKFGKLESTYKPGIKLGKIDEALPDFITKALRVGIAELDRKIKGFASPDAILTAIEARSSAVVRIVRDKETLESNIAGIYPSGEGAGYAGGITSSAIDGLVVAEKIIEKYL